MPNHQDLIDVATRLLYLAKAGADQRAMPDPGADEALRQAEEDLDDILARMED